jgi:hypothetical protein
VEGALAGIMHVGQEIKVIIANYTSDVTTWLYLLYYTLK